MQVFEHVRMCQNMLLYPQVHEIGLVRQLELPGPFRGICIVEPSPDYATYRHG